MFIKGIYLLITYIIPFTVAFLQSRHICTRQSLSKHFKSYKSNLIVKMSSFDKDKIKHNFSWQQTMLRIKDPSKTIPFYENNFGFKLIHK